MLWVSLQQFDGIFVNGISSKLCLPAYYTIEIRIIILADFVCMEVLVFPTH
jgi:hypothetical protein